MLEKLGLSEARAIVDRWFAEQWRAQNRPNLRQIDLNVARGASPLKRAPVNNVQATPPEGPAWEAPKEATKP